MSRTTLNSILWPILLLAFVAPSRSAQATKKELRVLFCGGSGKGKTSLCKLFKNLAADRLDVAGDLIDSDDMPVKSQQSQTKNNEFVECHGSDYLLKLIDTQGFFDTSGTPDHIIAQKLSDALENTEVHAVAFILSAVDARALSHFSSMIKQIKSLFPENSPLFSQIIVLITHADKEGASFSGIVNLLESCGLNEVPRYHFSSLPLCHKKNLDNGTLFEKAKIDLRFCGPMDPKDFKLERVEGYNCLMAINHKQFQKFLTQISGLLPISSILFIERRDLRRDLDNLIANYFQNEKDYDELDEDIECLTGNAKDAVEKAGAFSAYACEMVVISTTKEKYLVSKVGTAWHICFEDKKKNEIEWDRGPPKMYLGEDLTSREFLGYTAANSIENAGYQLFKPVSFGVLSINAACNHISRLALSDINLCPKCKEEERVHREFTYEIWKDKVEKIVVPSDPEKREDLRRHWENIVKKSHEDLEFKRGLLAKNGDKSHALVKEIDRLRQKLAKFKAAKMDYEQACEKGRGQDLTPEAYAKYCAKLSESLEKISRESNE